MPSPVEYRVVYPEQAKAALRAYLADLMSAGWDKSHLRKLLQTLDDRLRQMPLELGEPLYTLHSTNLQVRVGFAHALAANFGVHEEKRLVLVGKLVLMTTEP